MAPRLPSYTSWRFRGSLNAVVLRGMEILLRDYSQQSLNPCDEFTPIVNEEMSMDAKTRSTMANILGVTRLVYLVFLWTIVLNPLKRNVSFPGGPTADFLTMVLAGERRLESVIK